MARVAVVFPPLRISRDFVDYPYFADLGALSATAVLEQAGHQVSLCDALGTPDAGAGAADGSWFAIGSAPEIPAADVFVVAFTPFHRPPAREPFLGATLERIVAACPASPVVLADLYQSGQHYVGADPAQILAAYPEVSVLLRYEAEAVLAEQVARLALRRPEVPEVVDCPEPADLDALPLPAWHAIDVGARFRLHARVMAELGRPSWAFPIDGLSLPLVTSRGCPYRCIHCSSNPGTAPGAPKRQRRLSAAALARHLDQLVALGARRVHVLDELCNANERHFDTLLELVRERDLGLEIPNGLRADHLTERQIEALRGRVTTLSVSAESGAQRVVSEIVDKDLDLGQITRVAEQAGAAGVPLLVHFMIGLPGETREEINQTLDFALDLHERFGAWPSVQFATPLPGTRLARAVRQLPLVSDFGPYFQKRASATNDAASPLELEQFKQTFDLRLSAMSGPKKVILNVTYKCNNHCTFCALGTGAQVDGNFERQRQQLDDHRRRGATLLDLDGGEPTVYDQLFPLIHYARGIGYEKVHVTTNGRRAYYPEYAEKLAHSGATSILFSLHGPSRHVHAANVGVPEAFDQTLRGVKNVMAAAPAGLELGAAVTLTLSNHRHLGELAALVHELGLRRLDVQFLTPFGRATETVAPDTRQAAEIVMRVIDAWHDRMKLRVLNLPWCFLPGYEQYLTADLAMLQHHTVLVRDDEVNLFDYLRTQRRYERGCGTCTRKVFCGGFYRLADVPEPQWLLQPQDLVRPVAP
ncbi:MAG: radical SAM protein [Myxococcales bacterium]|nr:radical SAM protein [Myxococcales bacterium]